MTSMRGSTALHLEMNDCGWDMARATCTCAGFDPPAPVEGEPGGFDEQGCALVASRATPLQVRLCTPRGLIRDGMHVLASPHH